MSLDLKLSVVVVAWNGPAALLECLDSLGGQTETTDTEVLVISNFDPGRIFEGRFAFARHLRLPGGSPIPELRARGISARVVRKPHEGHTNGYDLIVNGDVQLLINTPLGKHAQVDDHRLRQAAIARKVSYTTTLSAASAACDAILALRSRKATVCSLQEWHRILQEDARAEAHSGEVEAVREGPRGVGAPREGGRGLRPAGGEVRAEGAR